MLSTSQCCRCGNSLEQLRKQRLEGVRRSRRQHWPITASAASAVLEPEPNNSKCSVAHVTPSWVVDARAAAAAPAASAAAASAAFAAGLPCLRPSFLNSLGPMLRARKCLPDKQTVTMTAHRKTHGPGPCKAATPVTAVARLKASQEVALSQRWRFSVALGQKDWGRVGSL